MVTTPAGPRRMLRHLEALLCGLGRGAAQWGWRGGEMDVRETEEGLEAFCWERACQWVPEPAGVRAAPSSASAQLWKEGGRQAPSIHSFSRRHLLLNQLLTADGSPGRAGGRRSATAPIPGSPSRVLPPVGGRLVASLVLGLLICEMGSREGTTRVPVKSFLFSLKPQHRFFRSPPGL